MCIYNLKNLAKERAQYHLIAVFVREKVHNVWMVLFIHSKTVITKTLYQILRSKIKCFQRNSKCFTEEGTVEKWKKTNKHIDFLLLNILGHDQCTYKFEDPGQNRS